MRRGRRYFEAICRSEICASTYSLPTPVESMRGPLSRATGSVAVFVLADLIADEATDRCASDGADGAAARDHGTTDRADACTDGRVPISGRHAAAAAE